jgi:hypothetical protein
VEQALFEKHPLIERGNQKWEFSLVRSVNLSLLFVAASGIKILSFMNKSNFSKLVN